MKYNTLLALHNSQDPMESLESAVALAISMQAHLEIRVLNMASPMPRMALNTNNIYDWGESLSEIVGKTEKRVNEIKIWLERQEISATVSSSTLPLVRIDEDVSEPALYSDLVLCCRPVDSIVVGDMAKALDGIIFTAGKPALILTDGNGLTNGGFKSISIAWDPVPEAMKALTASLPLLKKATDVELLVVTHDEESEPYTVNTKKILGWLRRHDIEASFKFLPQGNQSVSTALIDYINIANRDLIVLGAYGHSKFSERLFSGVSYQVLDHSKTSLLIAH